MTHAVVLTALVALSALGYRLRGAAWATGWPGSRVLHLVAGALPVALAALAAGVPPLWALGLLVAVAAADSLPHAAMQGAASPVQVALMSLEGLIPALPTALAMTFSNGLLAGLLTFALGLLSGPAYWLGNKLPIQAVVATIGFRQGPELGELCYGATRALFATVR